MGWKLFMSLVVVFHVDSTENEENCQTYSFKAEEFDILVSYACSLHLGYTVHCLIQHTDQLLMYL